MSLSLMCTLAVRGPLERTVLPSLQEQSGLPVSATWEPSAILTALIDRGARGDVLVAVTESVDSLGRRGIVEPSTRRRLATVGVGVAVPAGAPTPQLADEDSLRRALLSARSVAYSRSGASGLYFVSLLDRLGIRSQVEARATQFDKGFTATALLDGRADLAIQQLSELSYVEGVSVAGALPAAVQRYTEFSVARFTGRDQDGPQDLYDAILGLEARAAYREAGLVLV